MSRRTASWLAWSLAGLSVAIFLAAITLYVLAQSTNSSGNWIAVGTVSSMLGFFPFLAFPLVGALVASRRAQNPIGWICIVAGLLWMLIFLSESYSTYGLARPGSVPHPVAIHALLYTWVWVPAVGLLGIYLILLFPDGRLPSKRWRPLAWLSGAVIVSESVAAFLMPGPLQDLGRVQNPFGLEGQPWVTVVDWVALPLLPLCMLASALSLVLRYRRSGGEVREQIKWIALAASFMGVLYLGLLSAGAVIKLASGAGAPSSLGTGSSWGELLEYVTVLSFAGVPVAIGFAVLKYRLYEIDFLINRTLVYGLLTATLVAVYFGGIVVLQGVFVVFTGQKSQLAVVASTLAIAALFNPLRRRLQEFVDRRFYRRKYDAVKTLEAFSAKLRDETDLEALSNELVGVVRETIQPAHVSLWLRPDPHRGEAEGKSMPPSPTLRPSPRHL
jgi:hypothetical protein